jgi:hypothetical protein
MIIKLPGNEDQHNKQNKTLKYYHKQHSRKINQWQNPKKSENCNSVTVEFI